MIKIGNFPGKYFLTLPGVGGSKTTRRCRFMNNYEVLYIIENAIDDEAKEAVIKKFETVVTANNGTVDQVDKWGTKKYAYPIDYKNEGYYVLMTFTGEPSLPRELERQMGISDEIVRYMVTRK